MNFNSKIIEILKENGLPIDDSLAFLLSLHFNLKPQNFNLSDYFLITIQTTHIFEYTTNAGIKWLIPLFEGQEVAFTWVVTEYCKMFEGAGKDKNHRESISRMKELFSKNPDIRKDEVLGATRLYLDQTPAMYVRHPHYFIKKGAGSNMEQDLLSWIDIYRTQQEQDRQGYHNTLQ